MNSSVLNKFCDFIAKHYGDRPGKMLVHTGVIGWIMSSAAQIAAIIFNDKIPKEQKMFMIPQEFGDAFVNILAFYLVTNTFKNVGQKLVASGKWLPKDVKNFLVNNKLAKGLGEKGFDVLKKLTGAGTKVPAQLLKSYEDFGSGVDIATTFAGSILSCNLITPVLRNLYASHRQKTQMAKINNTSNNVSIKYNQPHLTDFQSGINRSYLKI